MEEFIYWGIPIGFSILTTILFIIAKSKQDNFAIGALFSVTIMSWGSMWLG